MTKTNCDICKCNIEIGYGHGTKDFIIPGLLHRNSVTGGATEVMEFIFKAKVESFHFSCTNFHICDKCMLNAMSKGLESQCLKIGH